MRIFEVCQECGADYLMHESVVCKSCSHKIDVERKYHNQSLPYYIRPDKVIQNKTRAGGARKRRIAYWPQI